MFFVGIQHSRTTVKIKRPVSKSRLLLEKNPLLFPSGYRFRFLSPVKAYSSRLVFDTCANPTTRSGDALYDRAERIVGTLGAVMSSPQAGTDVGPMVCMHQTGRSRSDASKPFDRSYADDRTSGSRVHAIG